jgi:ankyrin repeat protein
LDAQAEALVDAASAGDEAQVDRLLREGANPRYVDARKNDVLGVQTFPTALMKASDKGHCAIADKLIAAGADVHHRGFGGWTPLHSAVQGSYQACVRALIDARAEVNAKSELGYTPLREAVIMGDVDIVKMLLAAGADPDIADSRGESPRIVCRRFGTSEVRKLVDR